MTSLERSVWDTGRSAAVEDELQAQVDMQDFNWSLIEIENVGLQGGSLLTQEAWMRSQYKRAMVETIDSVRFAVWNGEVKPAAAAKHIYALRDNVRRQFQEYLSAYGRGWSRGMTESHSYLERLELTLHKSFGGRSFAQMPPQERQDVFLEFSRSATRSRESVSGAVRVLGVTGRLFAAASAAAIVYTIYKAENRQEAVVRTGVGLAINSVAMVGANALAVTACAGSAGLACPIAFGAAGLLIGAVSSYLVDEHLL